MRTTYSYPESTYSIDQILASIGIVIGMAVGIVAFVSAPIVVLTLTAGIVIGFVASRVQHNWPSRAKIRRRPIPEPSR